MAERTTATSWSYVTERDDTGAMIDLNFACPHCDYPTGEVIFVGPDNDLDGSWETDQVCGVCDKDVIVEVS